MKAAARSRAGKDFIIIAVSYGVPLSWGLQGGVFISSGMVYTQHALIWHVIGMSCIGL